MTAVKKKHFIGELNATDIKQFDINLFFSTRYIFLRWFVDGTQASSVTKLRKETRL